MNVFTSVILTVITSVHTVVLLPSCHVDDLFVFLTPGELIAILYSGMYAAICTQYFSYQNFSNGFVKSHTFYKKLHKMLNLTLNS